MLCENQSEMIYRAPMFTGSLKVDEGALVARFAARVNALGSLSQASQAIRGHLLAEVRTIAKRLDASREVGAAAGYCRRVLFEQPGLWSLAAIILRPGQEIHAHDHGGWGCAATVQGIERNRRFIYDAAGALMLRSEREYPPGTGYMFDGIDVHQPVGADPRQVTVALHFLVHDQQV